MPDKAAHEPNGGDVDLELGSLVLGKLGGEILLDAFAAFDFLATLVIDVNTALRPLRRQCRGIALVECLRQGVQGLGNRLLVRVTGFLGLLRTARRAGTWP